jgi:putative serine protease PepD
MALVAVMALTALVAAGVTLGVLQFQSRTNTQQVNLRAGVTIVEESAIVQVAAKAKPAVVSVVTQQAPQVAGASGYLLTSDGYIVTNVSAIAGATALTVLLSNDANLHTARLIDYDCETGAAVIKIDQVSGLPTLAFADPTALVEGQVLVAVGGPLGGGAVTPGYVSSLHQSVTVIDPSVTVRSVQISDTIQTNVAIGRSSVGGPLLNVGGQVVGLAMQSQGSNGTSGFGLNVADIQDEVQQILTTGQLVVPSLGVTGTDLSTQMALLSGLPEGSQITRLDSKGPADTAGLQVGDVITQLDDVKLDAAHPLSLLLRSRFHPNQRVTVTYSRAAAVAQVQLTLVGHHPTCA